MDSDWKKYIKNEPGSFCPGCLNGIIANMLGMALEELNFDSNKIVGVGGIGCSAWIADRNLTCDSIHTTHGRPIAFATGIKLANPDLEVLVISGDGDLATIGGNHLVHAARRNTPITVMCVNNFVYGMTGGQCSSTTPYGAYSTTTPGGNPDKPFDLIRLVLSAGCECAARILIDFKPLPPKAKTLSRMIQHPGFSFVEFTAPCVTHFAKKQFQKRVDRIKDYFATSYMSKQKARKHKPTPKQAKTVYGEFKGLADYMNCYGEEA